MRAASGTGRGRRKGKTTMTGRQADPDGREARALVAYLLTDTDARDVRICRRAGRSGLAVRFRRGGLDYMPGMIRMRAVAGPGPCRYRGGGRDVLFATGAGQGHRVCVAEPGGAETEECHRLAEGVAPSAALAELFLALHTHEHGRVTG